MADQISKDNKIYTLVMYQPMNDAFFQNCSICDLSGVISSLPSPLRQEYPKYTPHFKYEIKDGKCFITDLSHFGIFLKVIPKMPVLLENSQFIIGNTLVKLLYDDFNWMCQVISLFKSTLTTENIELDSQKEYIFGRIEQECPQNTIFIKIDNDNLISKIHTKVSYNATEKLWKLIDLNSSNGVFTCIKKDEKHLILFNQAARSGINSFFYFDSETASSIQIKLRNFISY